MNVVNRLLQDERVEPDAGDNYAIKWASRYGHAEVIDVLLQDRRVDPAASFNTAIRWASEYGHVEVVDRLLQDSRVDPSALFSGAICEASYNGHVEVVYRLLQDSRVNPAADDNRAIYLAAKRDHYEIMYLLAHSQWPNGSSKLPDDFKKYRRQIAKGEKIFKEKELARQEKVQILRCIQKGLSFKLGNDEKKYCTPIRELYSLKTKGHRLPFDIVFLIAQFTGIKVPLNELIVERKRKYNGEIEVVLKTKLELRFQEFKASNIFLPLSCLSLSMCQRDDMIDFISSRNLRLAFNW